MKQYNLNDKQILTWQQAYEWEQLPQPKYICFGRFPLTKEGKEFFAPFIQAGYIHKDTMKFTGVFRLTDKGKGIGGASILGKSQQRGKARIKQMQDYAMAAQRCIDQIVSGNGANHMRDAVEQIYLQDILNNAGASHINVINKDTVWTMVDDEKEIFKRDNHRAQPIIIQTCIHSGYDTGRNTGY